jgi:uncharacterized protein (TIGR02466 family)
MSIVNRIFPTPVFQYKNVKEATCKEIDFIENKVPIYRPKGKGNLTSVDNYILDTKEFKELKKVLTEKINSYFQKVYAPINKDIRLYITQSWLNYTSLNEYHSTHFHSNSIASGVYYFKVNQDVDKICFFQQGLRHIPLNIISETNTGFNSESWELDVENNMLVVFPSSLFHSVEQKKDSGSRISLAFNTFIKGTLGSKEGLTELELK